MLNNDARIWKVVGVLGLVIVSVISSDVALAKANDVGGQTVLSLYPSASRMELEPGSSARRTIEMNNPTAEPVKLEISTKPYSVLGLEYKPVFTTENKYTQIVRWVKFEQTGYTIEPKSKLNIPYTIDVPDDSPNGGQYAAVFVSVSSSAKNEKGQVIKRTDRLTHLIYARVKGDTRDSGSVQPMDFPVYVDSNKTDLLASSAVVKNNGNTDFDAEQILTVSSLFFGSKIYSHKDRRIVLPETARQMTIRWDKMPKFGVFRVRQDVEVLGKVESQFKIVVIAPAVAVIALFVVVSLVVAGVVIKIILKLRK